MDGSYPLADLLRLPSWVQPGVSFRRDYGQGNPNNGLFHVRGVVDERAVVRTWWRRKRRWEYVVMGPIELNVNVPYDRVVRGRK